MHICVSRVQRLGFWTSLGLNHRPAVVTSRSLPEPHFPHLERELSGLLGGLKEALLMSTEFHFAPKWSPKGWQLVMSLCTVELLLLWLPVLRRNNTIPFPLQMNSIPKNVIFYHWHQRVKHPFLCRGLLFLLFLVPGIPFVWTWIIGGSLFRFALLFFRQMSRGFKTAAFPCSSTEVTVTPWRAWVPPPLAGSQFHPFLKVISLLKRESSWRPFCKIFFPSLDPIKLWSWWQVRTACHRES